MKGEMITVKGWRGRCNYSTEQLEIAAPGEKFMILNLPTSMEGVSRKRLIIEILYWASEREELNRSNPEWLRREEEL